MLYQNIAEFIVSRMEDLGSAILIACFNNQCSEAPSGARDDVCETMKYFTILNHMNIGLWL